MKITTEIYLKFHYYLFVNDDTQFFKILILQILFNLNKNCKKQAQFYSDGKFSCSHIGDYGKYLERSQTAVSSKKRLIFVSEKKFTHSWEFFKKFTHSWEFFKKFTHSWEFFKKFTRIHGSFLKSLPGFMGIF